MVHRTATLLLQPTARQTAQLTRLVSLQCEAYNAALEERRGAWKWERRRVSRFDQYGELTGWNHEILEFGITPIRGTLLRLDRSFRDFFRRVKTGDKPGYPRFRSKQRFDSVEYPDASSWKITNGRLYLQGVGHIKFRASKRGIQGTPKTLVLRREGRRWRSYVVYHAEPRHILPKTNHIIGIDLGIKNLITTSDGDLIENQRITTANADQLADAQRIVAGRQRGSHRRRKAAQSVSEIHRKMARQRRDHLHKVSRLLVDDYDFIAHEDLKIANMVRRPKPKLDEKGGFIPNGAAAKSGLNREIHNAGWGILLQMLAYKAEEAGRELVAVKPHYTSQTCYECGHVAEENRVDQKFACTQCGHHDHADVNAAKNILRAGLALRLEREASCDLWCKAPTPVNLEDSTTASTPTSFH